MKYTLLNLAVRTTLLMMIGLLTLTPAFAAMSLDPAFGTGGRFTIAFPDSSTTFTSSGQRIYVQPSGRIIAVGTYTSRTIEGNLPGIKVFGVQSNGTYDPSYSEVSSWTSNGFISFRDSFMYPDGRVQIHGRWMNLSGSSNLINSRIGVNGSQDSGFANQIGVSGGFGTASAGEIALRGDDKLNAVIKDNGQLQLFRVNHDGSRDTTFGSNGMLPLAFNKIAAPSEGTFRLFTLADGKTLLFGSVPAGSGPLGLPSIFVARFTENGQWDKTFGRNGFLMHSFEAANSPGIGDVVLLPNGRLILAGSISSGGDTDIWMMRLRSNGRRDDTFGTNGVVVHDLLSTGTDLARGVTVSADGKVRIVGEIGSPANFLVARFSESGVYEDHTSFGFTAGESANGNHIAMQADGKIVVIGQTRNLVGTSGQMFAVARLIE